MSYSSELKAAKMETAIANTEAMFLSTLREIFSKDTTFLYRMSEIFGQGREIPLPLDSYKASYIVSFVLNRMANVLYPKASSRNRIKRMLEKEFTKALDEANSR